jgi:hypothetical protein
MIDEKIKDIAGFDYVSSQNTGTIFRFTTEIIRQKFEGKQQDFSYYLENTTDGLWLGLIMKGVNEGFIKKLNDSKIVKGKTQTQIISIKIEGWHNIKFGKKLDKESLKNETPFTEALQKVIEELGTFEEELTKLY